MPFTIEEVDDSLEPVSGDNVIGTLDHLLRSQYIELAEIETELMDVTDAMRKAVTVNLTSRLLNEWDGTPDHEWLRHLGENAAFSDEQEAYRYFELVARWEEANTAFWYRCKLSFKAFNQTCAIRQGFKVVSLGKKFKG